MTKFLFTVFDSAAKMYLDPFVAPTIEFATRGFREAVNAEGHQFGKFPEDYTLFAIGGFDAETGELIHQAPVSLGAAVTFVQQKRPASLLGDSWQPGDER